MTMRIASLLFILSLVLCGCRVDGVTVPVDAGRLAPVQRTVVDAPTHTTLPSPASNFEQKLASLNDKLTSLCWVAYSPSHFDPTTGSFPSENEIRADLEALHGVAFRGLVTYGSDNVLGQVPRLAREAGFDGVIMGIWDPSSQEERVNAEAAAAYVDAFNVGNEGLFFHRYDVNSLTTSMDSLRAATQKPVATTEVLQSYFDSADLRNLGDWIFPTAHAYWNGLQTPEAAVAWTQQQFDLLSDLSRGSSKVVSFKEVGWPSAGEPYLSEDGQARYFGLLSKTPTKFAHFEAFDQFWKTGQPVELHWGLFRTNRAPKPAAYAVCGKTTVHLPLLTRGLDVSR